MSAFDGLGKALRWLRAKQDKRQYQLAGEAGITKAMLSAYETAKQRPSLETLEKILDALGAELVDLHDALDIVNERSTPPGRLRSGTGWGWAGRRAGPFGDPFADPASDLDVLDVHRILGADRPLPPEEERAFREMLAGFHRLIRFLHSRAQPAPPEAPREP
jgi:transcriptional regulator with XRE-family HTH domain